MNTITTIITILTLWLIMGLGFLSTYAENHRKGIAFSQSLKSTPAILFILSIVFSLIYLAGRFV